ncbi:MAG: ankyrin repeat domain-containing protein [Planctomycetes bacterium]|nr:ankyrin repeat domain-containing protein [Planctomycetota bacterium]
MPVHPRLAHRGGLETQVPALTPAPEVFIALGGRAAVARLIDELYDRLLADPELRPMFSRDAAGERVRQKAFFEEWFGGEDLYSRHYANRGLRQIHHEIYITKSFAGRWLGHFREAMKAAGFSPKLQQEISKALQPLALALVNKDVPPGKRRLHCVQNLEVNALGKFAARGSGKVIAQALKAASGIHREWDKDAKTLLYHAAGAGKADAVESLLKGGADPNQASSTGWRGPMHTPLTHALLHKREEAAGLLRKHGAREDIFMFAALGDLEGLRRELAADPALAHAADLAHDIYRLTPLHHAVAAGRREAARFLLEHGAKIGRHSTLLAKWSAELRDAELLRVLLEHGADATRVGSGEWVLYPEVAALLVAHGADVDYASSPFQTWIWQACTGNNGKKDRPELTAAILALKPDVNSTKHWGKGALHFAAKAGFLKSVELLLEHTADPNLRDENGETPLFHAFKAGKSIDPKPVVAALLRAGAAPLLKDKKGRTVAEAFPQARGILTGAAKRPARKR